MFDNSGYVPPKVYSTEYLEHDRGVIFAGPPVIANNFDEAWRTVERLKGEMQLHPNLRIVGELFEENDTI